MLLHILLLNIAVLVTVIVLNIIRAYAEEFEKFYRFWYVYCLKIALVLFFNFNAIRRTLLSSKEFNDVDEDEL